MADHGVVLAARSKRKNDRFRIIVFDSHVICLQFSHLKKGMHCNKSKVEDSANGLFLLPPLL